MALETHFLRSAFCRSAAAFVVLAMRAALAMKALIQVRANFVTCFSGDNTFIAEIAAPMSSLSLSLFPLFAALPLSQTSPFINRIDFEGRKLSPFGVSPSSGSLSRRRDQEQQQQEEEGRNAHEEQDPIARPTRQRYGEGPTRQAPIFRRKLLRTMGVLIVQFEDPYDGFRSRHSFSPLGQLRFGPAAELSDDRSQQLQLHDLSRYSARNATFGRRTNDTKVIKVSDATG